MTASIRLSVKQGRKFGLTLGIALLVFGGLSIWRGHDIVPLFLLFPGAIMMLAGLLVPTRLGPVERGWMAFGHLLSRFMSPIILGIVYFGVLAPAGLLMRLFGGNPLKAHHKNETIWVVREKKRQSDLKRQF